MSLIMGQRIREMREKYNMSMDELAQKVGVTRQVISKWELGRVKNIDRDHIFKMSSIFHCDPAWLMHMENSNNVVVTYKAVGDPTREPVVAKVSQAPIIGAESLRAQLYQAALHVRPENLQTAIEILKTL